MIRRTFYCLLKSNTVCRSAEHPGDKLTTFLTALVSTYSITAIAAYGITGKLETILFYPAMALNMVLTTIVGQCIGGQRIDRTKDYLKCALKYGCILLFILSGVIVIFSRQLSGFFVSNTDVATIVGVYFLTVSIGYVFEHDYKLLSWRIKRSG